MDADQLTGPVGTQSSRGWEVPWAGECRDRDIARVRAEVDSLSRELLGPVGAAGADLERARREELWERVHKAAIA
jgi:hypothetical protein